MMLIHRIISHATHSLQDLDDLLFSINELTVTASTKWITIPCFSPTYIRGWTAQETTTLHRLLQFMKRNDWSFVMKYLPSKTLKQIRYKAKTLRPIERRPLAPHESLEITFHRDLRFTTVYRSTLALVNDFLADFESDLRASLNAKIFQFQGYTFTEDKPNYFRCEQFVYRHVPVNSTPLLAQVEDMSIRHLTDATRRASISYMLILFGREARIMENELCLSYSTRYRIIHVLF